MNRALPLLLALLTPGCVLSKLVLASSEASAPPQTARLEAGPGGARVVVEEQDGPRRRIVELPGVDPALRHVEGGPLLHRCSCFTTAWGLVALREPMPFEVVAPTGERRAVGAIVDPAVSWPGIFLPFTLALDLALSPVEAVFVGIVVASAE